MLELCSEILLTVAAAIARLFVTPTALNFDVVTMIIGILLFTLLVLIIAFWSILRGWFKHSKKDKRP